MIKKKIGQRLTIFSDGSLLFDLRLNNLSKKKIKELDKDLKIYQKNVKQKTTKNLSKSKNLNSYRKKYF